MVASIRNWWVYILRCSDGTLYTGIARDPEARRKVHERGRGARYTRGRAPLRLVFTQTCASHSEALRLEHAIKRLTAARKLALIASGGVARPRASSRTPTSPRLRSSTRAGR